ncbi:MAG TPA: prepilin peptidase [Isosphaeraceae bacterium]|nr:prepilin peptidase [Isosphaeraceae bacterium]
MFVTWPLLVALGLGVFLIGTVVGSFLNVCIYRVPWQKSVIWPASRCPICYHDIAARDNIPVISWIALRGECRSCGARISIRYLLVESLVGILFLAAFLIDLFAGPRGPWGQVSPFRLAVTAYHDILIALLVAATFIDYDLMIIPDAITRTGWILGIGLGTLWPQIRPAPSDAATHLGGFGIGLLGALVGAGLTQGCRLSFGFILRREAMGDGDVTLMGMIGAFLGWQAAVLTFFIAPFFGLGHAAWKLLQLIRKWLSGDQLSGSDRELPYGPYLSMAAVSVLLAWPWLWQNWAKALFHTLHMLFWWLLGINV